MFEDVRKILYSSFFLNFSHTIKHKFYESFRVSFFFLPVWVLHKTNKMRHGERDSNQWHHFKKTPRARFFCSAKNFRFECLIQAT